MRQKKPSQNWKVSQIINLEDCLKEACRSMTTEKVRKPGGLASYF